LADYGLVTQCPAHVGACRQGRKWRSPLLACAPLRGVLCAYMMARRKLIVDARSGAARMRALATAMVSIVLTAAPKRADSTYRNNYAKLRPTEAVRRPPAIGQGWFYRDSAIARGIPELRLPGYRGGAQDLRRTPCRWHRPMATPQPTSTLPSTRKGATRQKHLSRLPRQCGCVIMAGSTELPTRVSMAICERAWQATESIRPVALFE